MPSPDTLGFEPDLLITDVDAAEAYKTADQLLAAGYEIRASIHFGTVVRLIGLHEDATAAELAVHVGKLNGTPDRFTDPEQFVLGPSVSHNEETGERIISSTGFAIWERPREQ